jgi:hypothetical protein
MIFKTETFKPNMTGEVTPVIPVKRGDQETENFIQKSVDVSYAQTFNDIQNENYQKALKTRREIEELYKGDENGVIDFDKITELNYKLLCEGMWLSNINKGEYSKYTPII